MPFAFHDISFDSLLSDRHIVPVLCIDISQNNKLAQYDAYFIESN